MTTEAGTLTYLYGGKWCRQTRYSIFNDRSPLNVKQLSHVPGFIGGHSYFTDNGDSAMIAVRRHVADSCSAVWLNIGKQNTACWAMVSEGRITNVFGYGSCTVPGKLIHQDIAIGNAAAWQLWNSYEVKHPSRRRR